MSYKFYYNIYEKRYILITFPFSGKKIIRNEGKKLFLLSNQYYIGKLSPQIINGKYFMRYSAPCTLKNIFDNACEHSMLKSLQKKYDQLIYLDQVVKSVLPLHLHSWCRVINFHQGRLSLAFANAHAMNRLRYE
ncbi:MAG: DciA family protein, partial [Candidatus Dasytiphilus stammeri]